MNGHRRLAAVAVAASLLVVAGCSSGGSTKTVTTPNGGKVEVDKNGNAKYTDKNGNTYESNGDGSGSVKGSTGNADYSTGSATKLPDDWPSNLKPPKQVKLTAVYTTTSNGKKSRLVSGESSVPAQDLYDGVKQQLKDAGYEITGDTFSSGSSGEGGIITAKNDKYEVSVTIGKSATDAGKTTVVFSLTDASST